MSVIPAPSELSISVAASWWRRINWGMVGLAVILLAFGIFVWTHFAPAISEPDDNGYFAQGSLLEQTGHTSFTPESDAQYIGMHWLLTPSGQYISRYPPGLAAVVGAVYLVAGYKASVLVNPAFAVLAIAGMYLLARRVVPAGWALVAAAMLAINPTFMQHALACDAHMAVTSYLVWGLYLLVRWSQEGKLWQIFVAGIVLGCIPTIRYPEALFAAGIVAFMLGQWKKWPGIIRHYVAAVLGAAIPIIPLLIRNQLVMGAFWRTGYSLTNEQTGFSWEYFQEHAIEYVKTLHASGAGLMFGIGLVGIVCMICVRKHRAMGLMLALLCVPTLLLYMAYYWAPQGMTGATMRFLLPTFPLYALAGVWALDQMVRPLPLGARIALPLALVGVQMLLATTDVLQQANQLHYRKDVLATVTDAIESVAMPGDVVVANQGLNQHLDFVRRWKVADSSVLSGGMGFGGGGRFAPRAGSADAPSPMQTEKQTVLRERYTGTLADRRAKFAKDLRTWAGGHRVFIVGTALEVQNAFGDYLGADQLRIVEHVALPEAPVMTQRGRLGGMGGPGMGPPGGAGPPGGGRGGFGGFGRPPGGMGGGPMGGFAVGEKEIVIAEIALPEK